MIFIYTYLPITQTYYRDTKKKSSTPNRREYKTIYYTANRTYHVILTRNHFKPLIKRGITGPPPPSTGTWIVNQTTIVEDEDIILNGSIVVTENGSLILKNSTLTFNMSYDGEYNITVMANGSLYMNNTHISSMNNYRYAIFLFAGANLELYGSNLDYVGFNDAFPGLVIYCDNAIIQDTNISSGYIGVLMNGSNNISINNCHIEASNINIEIINCDRIAINNLSVIVSGTGVYIENSTHISISDTSLKGGTYCIHIEKSENISLAHINIDQKFRASSTVWGIYIDSSQHVDIDSAYIYMDDYTINKATHYAVYVSTTNNITIRNTNWNCSIYPSGSGTGWPPYTITSRIYQLYLDNVTNVIVANNSFWTKIKERLILLTLYYLYVYGIYAYSAKYMHAWNNSYHANISIVDEIIASGITSGTITYHWWNYLRASMNINITSNQYRTNQQITTGSYIYECTYTYMEENNFTGGKTAIYIGSSNRTRIENCYVNNYSLGLKIFSSSNISASIQISDSNEGIFLVDTNSTVLGGTIAAVYRSLYMKNTLNITLRNLEILYGIIFFEGQTAYNTTTVYESNYMGGQIAIYGGPEEVGIIGAEYGALLIGYTNGTIRNIVSHYVLIYRCDGLIVDAMEVTKSSIVGLWIVDSQNITLSSLSFVDCLNATIIESSTSIKIREIQPPDNVSILIQIYDSDDVIISSSYVSNLYYFMYVFDSSGIVLENTTIIDCVYGIYTDSSSTRIINSSFSGCCYAITIMDVSGSYIENNVFYDCFIAIRAKCGPTINVVNNTFLYCTKAISLDSGYDMYNVDREKVYADIFHNNISYCHIGIEITCVSGEVNVTNTFFAYNDIGIYYKDIHYSSSMGATLRIIHNKFLYNLEHAIILEIGNALIYGNAFFYENPNVVVVGGNATAKLYFDYYGNYWSEYMGDDLDKDGIIDEPFYIDGLVDLYPLVIEPSVYFDRGIIINIANYTYLASSRYVYLFTDISNTTALFAINNSDVLILFNHPYVYYINVSKLQNGEYYLNLTINNTGYMFLIYFMVDKIAPLVNINITNYTWLSSTCAIKIETSDDFGVDHVVVLIDGETYMTIYQETIVINISDIGIGDGIHNITVVAVDYAGNVNTKTVFFYKDTEEPQVYIEAPYGVLSDEITMGINATDNMGLSYVIVLVDGYSYANYSIDGTEYHIDVSIDTTLLGDGNHTFTIIVFDNANNSFYIEIMRNVDNTPPTIRNVVYRESITLDNEYCVIYFEIDDNTGVKAIYVVYSYAGTTENTSIPPNENGTYIYAIPLLDTGSIVFRIIAIDIAETRTESGPYIIIVEPETTNTTTITTTTKMTEKIPPHYSPILLTALATLIAGYIVLIIVTKRKPRKTE